MLIAARSYRPRLKNRSQAMSRLSTDVRVRQTIAVCLEDAFEVTLSQLSRGLCAVRFVFGWSSVYLAV